MEHKWATIPIILIIALIGVFVFAYYFESANVNEVGDADYADVGEDEYLNIEYVSPDENGIGDEYDFSTSSGDYQVAETPEECNALSESGRDNCLSLHAVFHQNEDACALIEERSEKDECFSQIAIDKKDGNICDNVLGVKSECFSTLGVETNNVNYCEKAGLEKRQCIIAAASGKFEDCAEGLQKRYCNDAVAYNDASHCDNIIDEAEFCYYNVAKNTNASSLCNKAGPSRDSCFFQIAVNSNNEQLCENLTDTRDNCIAWVAINTNNKDLCFKLSSAEVQSCIEDVSAIN
ncbi:MAG TPA: hypothetical protein VFF13_03500 [archaeon]|nr:hypothetical protein [archaeon]